MKEKMRKEEKRNEIFSFTFFFFSNWTREHRVIEKKVIINFNIKTLIAVKYLFQLF